MTAESVLDYPNRQEFEPEAYLLLVGFGGQLEPKIYRELMAGGIHVKRVVLDPGAGLNLDEVDLSRCQGVILSGGNDSVYDETARVVPEELMDLPVPKLGICYGQQALIYQLGGDVQAADNGEYGVTTVSLGSSALFTGIASGSIKAMMNHRDVVTGLPPGFRIIAESSEGVAGVTNDKDIYAVQFHPESSDTEYGTQVLVNFATEVCGLQAEPDFTEEKYRMRIVEQEEHTLRSNLGKVSAKAIVFDSGGVDSAVAHVLADHALGGDRLRGIYIDTGLMRHEDGDTIRTLNSMGYSIEVQNWVDFFLHERVPLPESEAKKRGYTHLPPMDQTVDPAIMRQIVKYGCLEVQRRNAKEMRAQYAGVTKVALIQGTNLADKIESGDFGGDQIKEHHNSGIEEFVDELFEPLATLFKGDIRKIAIMLGLPADIAFRQPFPGPGLCLRIPANITGETIWPENIDAKRRKLERICKSIGDGALEGCWLPVTATGQKGDKRIVGNMVLLSGAYDPELLEKLAFDIPAQTGATRVVYTEKIVDPDVVTSTQQMVNEQSLGPLKDAEEMKRQILIKTALQQELSQHYVASLPVSLTGRQSPTLMTRMFRTGVRSGLEDYITGEAALGGLNVDMAKFQEALSSINHSAVGLGYERAIYELTNKPPGTVELS